MAAGLGFKDFTTGEVLTAADVDGYLMQGVWVFASAAARDAAVTSPQEGNFAFLKDTNTTTYYTGSAWANLVSGAGASINCAVFIDQKTATAGGTFTSGAWRTRDINTSQFNNITSASIASNQITLPAGTFMIVATAPFQRVDQNVLRFQNITDTTTAIEGQNAYTDAATAVAGLAYLSGIFTIAGSKTFELQHRCVTTRAADGFGASNTITTDVYSIVSIWKVG